MSRPNYSYSVPFDRTITGKSLEFDAVVSEIFSRIEGGLGSQVERHAQTYKNNIRVLAANLFAAHNESQSLFVGYARNHQRYRAIPARYNQNGVSICMIKIIDAFLAAGLIADDHAQGYYDHDLREGRQSRMRASEKLIGLMRAAGVKQSHIAYVRELVVLKAPKKKGQSRASLMDYEETPKTKQMKENLQRINDMILNADIRLDLSPSELEELNTKQNREGDVDPSTRANKMLYRVFNNAKFSHGGRFYGHWVQGLPKAYRKHVLINGNPVSELDYSCQHIFFLYHLFDKTPPAGDMYKVSGFDPVRDRGTVKTLLQALLNAATETDAIKAVFRDIVFEAHFARAPIPYTRPQLVAMVEAIKAKHPEIQRRMGTGAGIKLQYLDSYLAEQILLNLADKNIPAIPIHDSFLVESRYAGVLESAMQDEYKRVLKELPKIKREF